MLQLSFNLQLFHVFSITLIQGHVYYILVGHFYLYDVIYWMGVRRFKTLHNIYLSYVTQIPKYSYVITF